MGFIRRSYRIRVYPNGAQRRLIEQWLGATRWLWNTALAIRSEAYRVCRLKLTGNDLSRWLTQWKRTPGHEWLAKVPATVLTRCLLNQDRAFRNFFAQRARYPRFKRRDNRGSLQFQDVGTAWASGVVGLPKLGTLKLAESLPRVERPDAVTLSRDAAGHYYISFSARIDASSLPIVQRSVGVDLGLTHLATLSTGEKIPNPKHYHARLRYLRQQQHCLARGRSARAIQDAAFSEIRRQLTYKSDWYGRILVEVDRWYASSKRCSKCQYTLDVLRLDQRQWTCPQCGTHHDRDVNAARNLLAEGLRQLAGRDDRDLRVDARGACPDEIILVQVLAEEARSGHCNRTCRKQVGL